MRALMISPAMPARTGGGLAMRMGLFLEALTRVARTDVLVLPLGGLPPGQATLDEIFSASCRVIPVQGREDTLFQLLSRIQNPVERLRAFRAYGRSSLSAGLSAAVLADIAEATAGQAYDLVHVGRAYLAEAGLAVKAASLHSLDADENDALAFRRRAALAQGHERDWALAEADACERLQQATLGHYNPVFSSSAMEAEALAPFMSNPVTVIPNAVVPPQNSYRRDDGHTLLFVGSLGFWPNMDGLAWFASDVWPELVKRAKQKLRLMIVGRGSNPEIERLARLSGISVHADVAKLDEFYNQATLAIVPLRTGGGTRIKLIEAALFGVSAVSTRVGAEGLSFQDGHDIWLADDAHAMVEHIIQALENPAMTREFGARAKARAEAHYSHEQVCHQLACIWEGQLSRRGP